MKPDIFIFKSRNDWRDWLNQNNTTINEIWLAIFKKGSKIKGLSYDEAVEEALCFGWIDGHMKSVNENYFQLRFTPRRKNSPWSLLNKNRALKMIKEGKMTQFGLIAIDEAKQNCRWDSAYSSKVETQIPIYLLNELEKNEKALKQFLNLPLSHKSRYIHWILEAKRAETKTKRIEQLVKNILNNFKKF